MAIDRFKDFFKRLVYPTTYLVYDADEMRLFLSQARGTMNKIETIYNTVIHSFEQIPDLDIKEFSTLKLNTNEEVVLKILARFRVTLTECVQNMSEGLEKKELERIWQAAHKIAGSAQLLGFKDLGVESRELYQELKKSNRLEASEQDEIRELIQYGRLILKEIETNFPQHAEFL